MVDRCVAARRRSAKRELAGLQVQAHAANTGRELNHLLSCREIRNPNVSSSRLVAHPEGEAATKSDQWRTLNVAETVDTAADAGEVSYVAEYDVLVTYRAIPSPMVRTRPVSWTSAPAVEPEMRDSRMEATSEAAVAVQYEVSRRSRCALVKKLHTGLGGSVGPRASGSGALEVGGVSSALCVGRWARFSLPRAPELV